MSADYVQWYLRPVHIGRSYNVTVYDKESQPVDEYDAGDHPAVSDMSAATGDGVSALTLIRWAKQSAAEYAVEHGLDADKISHDRDSESELSESLIPEYAFTDEMPSGNASYYRGVGYVIFDRDGDIVTTLPAQCRGLVGAMTEWLNAEDARDYPTPAWLAGKDTDALDYKTPAEEAGFGVVMAANGQWTWVGEDHDHAYQPDNFEGLTPDQIFETEDAAWRDCCETFEIDPYPN